MMEDGRSAAFVGALAEAGRFAATFANDLAGRSATFVGDLAEAGGLVAGAAVFVVAFTATTAGAAVVVGALETGLIALGGLITVATPLSLGGIMTENSSSCSLDSFLGGSKGALAKLRRLSPG